ncbi:MAG: hypothetical protein JSS75_11885 [Bacteroidetes bacterium]|nr:hypothetical protein [Bacteroidota bacterium]
MASKRIRRPPLTEKTMLGLLEIIAFVRSAEPADILGDDPRSWRGTPRAAELSDRQRAIEAACNWIESLQEYRVRKTASRATRRPRIDE